MGARRHLDVEAAVRGLPDGAAEPVRAYLRRIDRALPAPARTRREALAEVADGLACAVEEAIAAGTGPANAARDAITELGPAETLAAGYAAELARSGAHRFGAALVLTGPLVGVAWLAAGAPGDLTKRLDALHDALPILPLFFAVSVPAALIAVTGAGVLARRLPFLTGWSARGAVVGTAACIAADVMLLATAALAPAGRDHLWLGVAATASAARLIVAAIGCHRVARLELAAG